MRRGFLGGPSGKGVVSERVRALRARVEEAEAELRSRREERVQFEALKPAGVQEDREFAFFSADAAAERRKEAAALPALDGAAVDALASHEGAPPECLHRLAQALMLVSQATHLIELGEHPLPKRTSWGNLQLLLRKSEEFAPREIKEMKAALSEPPHGLRIAEYIRSEVLCLGGPSELTRAAVEKENALCVNVLDWVSCMLGVGAGEGAERPKKEAAPAPKPAPSEEELEKLAKAREHAMEAVANQEREVSRLRKELREVERQEVASQRFASENDPSAKAIGGYTSELSSEKQPAAAADPEPKQPEKATPSREGATLAKRAELQYRLFETGVSEINGPTLEAMVSMLMDPRATGERVLEVTGFCETKEEAEVAGQRGAAVHEWLLKKDVPRSRIFVLKAPANEPGGKGKRVVEIRLLDTLDQKDVRDKAQKAFSYLGLDGAAGAAGAGPTQAALPTPAAAPRAAEAARTTQAAPGAGGFVAAKTFQGARPGMVFKKGAEGVGYYPDGAQAAPAGKAAAEPAAKEEPEARRAGGRSLPRVSVEEGTSDGGRRQLRLVFSAPDGAANLAARDAALEVSGSLVRLASLSDSWPELEVPLPFAVEDPDAGAAKFSKRAGTLTVTLLAVE